MKLRTYVTTLLACGALVAGCSNTTTGGGGYFYVDGKGSDVKFSADGSVLSEDGSTSDDATGDANTTDAASGSDGSAADTSITDSSPGSDSGPSSDTAGGGDALIDTGSTILDTGPDVVDLDSFFDPDTGVVDSGPAQDVTIGGGLAFVFAHSSDTLYRMDKSGFIKIGYFSFNQNAGSMTDIAMDKSGTLYGVTFDDLFKCDSKTAKCTWLASLPESFNGLTFVPKGTVKANDEALIGIANSGTWNLIEVTGTTAKVTKLGSYGSYSSSGDAFSVESVGTFATVKDANSFGGTDILVQVDPTNGAVIKKIGDTGVSDLWGFAWFGGKFYGFSDDTNVYEVDTTTGKATLSNTFKAPTGVQWWGAAVSTRAALD